MHKDHYENLIYVLSGEKLFTLCPPADALFLPQQQWESGTLQQNSENGTWCVQPDEPCGGSAPATCRWIQSNVQLLLEDDVQQHHEILKRYPLLTYAHPIQVKVSAGEMLYLPSLWFHRVTQSCETVAINYWYDMKFNSPHWCYFNFLQEMVVNQIDEELDGDC
jgi:jumonji domain-containing protein 7